MEFSFDNLPELPELPEWKPISLAGGCAWLVVYGLFLIYAYLNTSGFWFPDFVNLMIHEAGHPAFSWGGHTLMLLGGTLGELIVPLGCAVYFFLQRQIYGFAFSIFWFFENFPYIGTYMADARDNALPLVNGDIGDWTLLFGQWGLMEYDRRIGHVFHVIGWTGMIAVMAWLGYRTYRAAHVEPELRPLQM
jgi:hypothetical protein